MRSFKRAGLGKMAAWVAAALVVVAAFAGSSPVPEKRITVVGGVKKPRYLKVTGSITLKEALRLCEDSIANLGKRADGILIRRRNDVVTFKGDRKGLAEAKLQPFDVVYVPEQTTPYVLLIDCRASKCVFVKPAGTNDEINRRLPEGGRAKVTRYPELLSAARPGAVEKNQSVEKDAESDIVWKPGDVAILSGTNAPVESKASKLEHWPQYYAAGSSVPGARDVVVVGGLFLEGSPKQPYLIVPAGYGGISLPELLRKTNLRSAPFPGTRFIIDSPKLEAPTSLAHPNEAQASLMGGDTLVLTGARQFLAVIGNVDRPFLHACQWRPPLKVLGLLKNDAAKGRGPGDPRNRTLVIRGAFATAGAALVPTAEVSHDDEIQPGDLAVLLPVSNRDFADERIRVATEPGGSYGN